MKLQEASTKPRTRGRAPNRRKTAFISAPLTGKFRDETGDRLTPSHTQKGRRRIRYYVSNRLLGGTKDPGGWRLPAAGFENTIAVLIADHLERAAGRHALLARPDAGAGTAHLDCARALAGRLRSGDLGLFSKLVVRGWLDRPAIRIRLDADVLATALDLGVGDLDETVLTLVAPFELRRRGVETRIVVGDLDPGPDPTLIRGLARAHAWAAELRAGTPISLIARRAAVSEAYIRPRVQLACLSPRIQTAILEGRQSAELTLESLVRSRLPLEWTAQEHMLGLPAA